jgi:hypothetical protein
MEQGKAEGFFTNVDNADKLRGLVEDIRDAMIHYQVCFANTRIFSTSDICFRLCYSRISTTKVASLL